MGNQMAKESVANESVAKPSVESTMGKAPSSDNAALEIVRTSRFLALPTELLQKIFRYALVAKGPLSASYKRYTQSRCDGRDYSTSLCGILLTCRLFGQIAAPILYKKNVIHFRDAHQPHTACTPITWRELIGPTNAAMVNSIVYGSMIVRFEWMPPDAGRLRKIELGRTAKAMETLAGIKVKDAAMLSGLRDDSRWLEELLECFPNLAAIEIRTIRQRWTPTPERHSDLMKVVRKTNLTSLHIRTYYRDPDANEDIEYDFSKWTVSGGGRSYGMEECGP